MPKEGETLARRVTSRSRADYKIDHETGCWVWAKSLDGRGYPTGRPKAHRAYFQLANPGVDIAGLDVHHKCRNTACVNPDHLEALPHKKHLSNHRREESRFTEADIVAIRSSTDSIATLAERYGVPHGTIGNILWGVFWAGIGPARPETYCVECGERITTGKRHKQYCSEPCKTKAFRRRRSERARQAA